MAARPNERKAPRKEGELAAPQSRGRSCGPCGLLDRPRAYKRQNGADDAGDCRECYSPQTEQSGSARQEGCERSEDTSELQSLMRISYAVFCLNKKNNSSGN